MLRSDKLVALQSDQALPRSHQSMIDLPAKTEKPLQREPYTFTDNLRLLYRPIARVQASKNLNRPVRNQSASARELPNGFLPLVPGASNRARSQIVGKTRVHPKTKKLSMQLFKAD